TEWHVGTGPTMRCSYDGWPADLYPGGMSPNKITIQDVTSFLAPTRRLDTSLGDAGYSLRWDILPGTTILTKQVNIQDLVQILVVRPPMLNGAPAFNQTCPGP